jgi:hypothetical protein
MVERAYRRAIRIFAVLLHVVRIGDSAPAPMFEVLERPNNWERQMHAEQRGTRIKSRRAEDRGAFWVSILQKMPKLSERGVAKNGSASQWIVPDGVDDLVVSIYITMDGVGVFLRGLRGTTPSEVLERFEPQMFEFKRLVADEMYDATGKTYPGCAYKTDMKDLENWGEAIEWLCDKAQLWLDATSQVFGEAHDRRSKFNYEQGDLREVDS